MTKGTKLKIQMAKRGDPYYSGWGGHYVGPDGRPFLLAKSRATTFAVMKDLKTRKEQFEFFCLAYIRELSRSEIAVGGSQALEARERLVAKYGMPWNGNVKNVLPAIGESCPDLAVIKRGGGLNTELLREKFNEYTKYHFVIYGEDVSGPPTDNDGKPLITGNQLWDLEVGNYTYHKVGPYKRAFVIPNSVDFPELRKRLTAAALSVNLGVDSIDHVLKHYVPDDVGPELGNPEEPSTSLLDILENLKSHLDKFQEEHYHQHDDHGILGIVAASYALARCQSTLEACLILSGRGFFVDACMLGRHVIEQVAWALSVAELNDMEAMRKVAPQKCISQLGFQSYGGWLYGTLSEFTHLSVKRRHEYLRMINDRPATIRRSTEDALRLSPLLILVLDTYISGCELFFMKECSQDSWQSWEKKDGKWVLNPERPLLRLFKEHHGKYKPPV